MTDPVIENQSKLGPQICALLGIEATYVGEWTLSPRGASKPHMIAIAFSPPPSTYKKVLEFVTSALLEELQ